MTADPSNVGASHTPPRAEDLLDRHIFPIDPWSLTECQYDPWHLGRNETIFAVANGYLGMRGNVEEGRDSYAHGTYINGFHETFQIQHAEEAFGFARVGQTMVNVPDAKLIRLYVDDEPLLLSIADLETYSRVLDFRAGRLVRSLIWRTPAGKKVKVDSTRMVSMTSRHLAIMTFEVTLLDSDAPVAISSQLLNRQDGEDEYHVRRHAMGQGNDPRKTATFDRRVLNPQSIGEEADSDRMIQGFRCAESGMTIAVGVDHIFESENDYTANAHFDSDVSRMTYRVDALKGVPIKLVKYAVYHTSRGVPARELVEPLPPYSRPCARARRRPLRRRAAEVVRRLLGAQRRRGGRAAGDPAGREVEPLPARPGRRPRRGRRHPREGCHRQRLQRPLLLGHRGLHAAVPHLHDARMHSLCVAVPLQAARHGPAARAPDDAARRAVPLAHHQRRGGVGVLRRRHRAVPHRRGHRLRASAVRRRHRRPGVHGARGRRHPRRDRTHVGGPRLLAVQRRRRLPHPRRDRARRVHHRRRRQPLHERDGARQPARRGRHGAAG